MRKGDNHLWIEFGYPSAEVGEEFPGGGTNHPIRAQDPTHPAVGEVPVRNTMYLDAANQLLDWADPLVAQLIESLGIVDIRSYDVDLMS